MRKLVVALLVPFALAVPAARAGATTTTLHTGSWTVPDGVTCATFTVTGAAGGGSGGGFGSPRQTGGVDIIPGGHGAVVVATVGVTAGSKLTITVGGQGTRGSNAEGVNSGKGGEPGGGGDATRDADNDSGGGGGGYSSVALGATQLVVAGGGGGGGSSGVTVLPSFGPAPGGDGGSAGKFAEDGSPGTEARDGANLLQDPGLGGAAGDNGATGGAGGAGSDTNGTSGTHGTAGHGGTGGLSGTQFNFFGSGGGGGGGWPQGGGGGGGGGDQGFAAGSGGGGAGASMTTATARDVSITTASDPAGSVSVTYGSSVDCTAFEPTTTTTPPTTAAPATTIAPNTANELPRTGSSGGFGIVLALTAIGLGTGLVVVGRRGR